MKKKLFCLITLAFFGLIFIAVTVILAERGTVKRKHVCFRGYCFNVAVVSSLKQRKRGLMDKKELLDREGMLFVFKKEDKHPFWMKNMLIPLDIIWLDRNNEIVFIKNNAQPCGDTCPLIYPDKKAMYVLEIKSGKAKEIGLRIGDKAVVNY